MKPEEWENRDLPSYLEAIAAWVDDMDGYYRNLGEDSPTSPLGRRWGKSCKPRGYTNSFRSRRWTVNAFIPSPLPSHSPRTRRPTTCLRNRILLAPSLPLLTSAEENQLDKVIDRFMPADTDQLRGEEAKAAFNDFYKLGPELVPGPDPGH